MTPRTEEIGGQTLVLADSAPMSRDIIRVFPRRTAATPTDPLAFVKYPPLIHDLDPTAKVMVSCAFTWDKPFAEELADAWALCHFADVEVGGPAYGRASGAFEPGLFLGEGYVVTSRGCPNNCPHCLVPKREGGLRELPICDGWIVQDDNLLACSEKHVRAVFAMLARQPRSADLRGLEAKLLKPWHVDLLADARVGVTWFAYDDPAAYEPLVAAGRVLAEVGITLANRKARCYVLIGQPGDTLEAAEKRLWQTVAAGFMPFAMLYRDEANTPHEKPWNCLQRSWARPAAIATMVVTAPPPAATIPLDLEDAP